MSKNLTRKGLAFGAGFALVASGFAAVPAQADTTGPITLEPDAGETFNSLQQTGITLQSELDPNVIGVEEAGSLAFLIENPGAAKISADFDTAGALNEQINYRSDTSWAVAGIPGGEQATKAQRLNGLADTTASDGNLHTGTTYAADDAKFVYVTGSSTSSVSTYFDAIYQKEVQNVAVTVANSSNYAITLPNGAQLTMTSDGDAVIAEILAGLRADVDYDNSYAVLSQGAGDSINITYQQAGVEIAETAAGTGIAASTETTPHLKADTGWNLGSTLGANTLTISMAAADFVRENVTLHVTAWLDANGNGKIDTFEKASDRETVTLYAIQNVSATTTLNNDLVRNPADKLMADIVLNNDINMEQVGSSIGAVFYKNGLPIEISAGNAAAADSEVPITASANGAGADIKDAAWNSSLELLRATAYNWVIAGAGPNGNTPALGVGNYSAIAVYIGSNTTTDTDRYLGTSSPVVSLNNGLVTGVVGAYVKGASTADVKYTNGAEDVDDLFDVRAGTKTVTFTVQVTKADGTDAGSFDDDLKAANVEVRADFTAARLATGASVTVSGQSDGTLKFTGDIVTSRARTNSDGVATFTVTSANGVNLDQIDVDVFALDSTGAWVTAAGAATDGQEPEATITWKTTALGAFTPVNTAVSGDTIDLAFNVTDNFNQAISTTAQGALKVYMVAVVNGVESPSTFSRTVDVVNGSAAASVANFVTKGTPALVVRGYLYRSGYESATANALLAGQALKTVTVYNHAEVSAVQVPAALSVNVTYSDYRTGNSNIDPTVLLLSDLSAGDAVVLNGFVANANGAGLAASKVEVSGAGLLFESGGIYATDSISVYAATDGTYSINVWSQTASTTGVTITSTSGGKSSTTLLKTYLPTALDGKNLVFTWSLPANIVKNTTYAVTAKLADKWGNPVATSTNGATPGVTFTGAGSVQVNGVNTAVGANFDATGTATVFVRSVKDIAGPGSITAALGAANYRATSAASVTALNVDLETVNVTTTVWDETKFVNALGSVVEVLDVAPTATDAKLNAGSFNGYVAVYAKGYKGATLSWKIAGQWFRTTITEDYQVFQRRTAAVGVDVNVELYINGVRPAAFTKTVTTK